VTLVSWALTASAKGVVDPSKTSFSFAYTKRAFPLSETSSTIPFFRTDCGRIGNVRDYVRGSGDTLFAESSRFSTRLVGERRPLARDTS